MSFLDKLRAMFSGRSTTTDGEGDRPRELRSDPGVAPLPGERPADHGPETPAARDAADPSQRPPTS